MGYKPSWGPVVKTNSGFELPTTAENAKRGGGMFYWGSFLEWAFTGVMRGCEGLPKRT